MIKILIKKEELDIITDYCYGDYSFLILNKQNTEQKNKKLLFLGAAFDVIISKTFEKISIIIEYNIISDIAANNKPKNLLDKIEKEKQIAFLKICILNKMLICKRKVVKEILQCISLEKDISHFLKVKDIEDEKEITQTLSTKISEFVLHDINLKQNINLSSDFFNNVVLYIYYREHKEFFNVKIGRNQLFNEHLSQTIGHRLFKKTNSPELLYIDLKIDTKSKNLKHNLIDYIGRDNAIYRIKNFKNKKEKIDIDMGIPMLKKNPIFMDTNFIYEYKNSNWKIKSLDPLFYFFGLVTNDSNRQIPITLIKLEKNTNLINFILINKHFSIADNKLNPIQNAVISFFIRKNNFGIDSNLIKLNEHIKKELNQTNLLDENIYKYLQITHDYHGIIQKLEDLYLKCEKFIKNNNLKDQI